MNPSSAVPRREFLSTAAKAVVTVGLFDLNVWPGPRHTALAISTVTIDLTLPANSALTAVGGSQYVALAESPDFDMIVIRNSATAVSAFLSRCTHAGGVVDLPVSHVCTCPLHGSTFDESGNVTKGPAKTNLDKFKAVLNGSVITISTLTGVLGRTGGNARARAPRGLRAGGADPRDQPSRCKRAPPGAAARPRWQAAP